MIAAAASLLLMLLGCAGLIMHVTTDAATLPLDQRALFEAEPKWVLAASAVGFVAGACGALLLILRRRAAEGVMLISLIGMIVWLAGMLLTPRFRDLLSTGQIAVLLVIVALTWTIFWFARHSRQRGWLR
jgi:putative Mn2+ efflux pump MntP